MGAKNNQNSGKDKRAGIEAEITNHAPLSTEPFEAIQTKLEELIILAPADETCALIEARSYLREHDNLVGCECIAEYIKSKKEIVSAATRVVKRAIFNEAGVYLANMIACLQKNEEAEVALQTLCMAGLTVPSENLFPGDFTQANLFRKRAYALSIDPNHNKLYQFLVLAYSHLGTKLDLPLDGRINTAYIGNFGHLLELTNNLSDKSCSGWLALPNTSFKFLITDSYSYARPERRLEGYDYLFRPIVAYLNVKSLSASFVQRLLVELKTSVRKEQTEEVVFPSKNPMAYLANLIY